MIEKKTAFKADMMLLFITLCWGVSYFLTNVSLTEVPTFTVNAYRFLGAFAVAGLVTFRKMQGLTKESVLAGGLIGIALAFVYAGCTLGLQSTTTSNCAFLCATAVFFTPILDFLVFRNRLQRKMLIALTLCIAGICLMTLNEDFSLNISHLKGDLFSLSCGFFYAIDIIATAQLVKNQKVDPYQMGVVSLGACGGIMLLLSLLWESPIAVPHSLPVWGAVIFLTIFCTGVAFVLQPVAQQYTSPSHVGIIFSLEPVFAGVTAFLLEGEVLTMRGYIGEILMIIALFYMELDFSAGKQSTAEEAETEFALSEGEQIREDEE